MFNLLKERCPTIYEIRVKKYMGVGSSSLDKFYKNKDNAEKVVEQLNKMLNLYYVNEVKLEDEE